MYKILGTILITALTTFGINNFVPLKYFEALPGLTTNRQLGATITTIAGSDTLSNSRTTINTNFANLNSDKVETSTTTMSLLTSVPNLETVGTLTTGVWNGTAIGVAYGGTASTTICLNNVILGNTTSGFKCTAGHGTVGQFLTSGGAGAAPTWTSGTLDVALDYAWTGEHSFTSATTTRATITTLFASTTNITTLRASVPSPTASSTILARDSSDNIYWLEGITMIASTTLSSTSNTIDVQNIPGREQLWVYLDFASQSANSVPVIIFNNIETTTYNQNFIAWDSTPTVAAFASTSAAVVSLTRKTDSENTGGYFRLDIMNPLGARKSWNFQGWVRNTDPIVTNGSGTWNNTTAQINRITARLSGNATFPAGSRLIIYGSSR